MRRFNAIELVDAAATLVLLPVVWWEAVHDRDAPLANAVIFAVLALVFLARLRRGDWRAMSGWERVLELGLLALALPVPNNRIAPLRLLRLLRLPLLGVRTMRGLRRGLVQQGAVVVVGAAVLTVLVGSTFVLEFERDHPGTAINTVGDALWWAAVTMTTVGYGDLAPKSAGGRITAVALMVVGITLFGLMTALVARWLVGGGEDEPATAAQVDALLDEVRRLR